MCEFRSSVLEMKSGGKSLEDIFLELTSGNEEITGKSDEKEDLD